MEAIPPTKSALIQHIKRAVYQGGYCWDKMLERNMCMPPAENWGWMNPHEWKPLWTLLPQASSGCQGTIPLWLQTNVHRKMKEGGTKVYSFMFV